MIASESNAHFDFSPSDGAHAARRQVRRSVFRLFSLDFFP